MKISIITVAYNAEKTIEDTIKSVISQTYPEIEYILIDGKSTDNTLGIAFYYKDSIETILSEPDEGLYDAMNKGIQRATGDVIGILNADDFYADNNVVADIAKILEQNPESDGVYADLQYVDPENTTKVVRTWISGNYKKGSFKNGWMMPHPTLFVKKTVYQEIGTYSLELKSAADYEFMLRMMEKHNKKVSYLPRVITYMRTGGTSNISLKNRWLANREDKLAWKMNDLKPSLFTFVFKPLSKVSQFFKK